MQKSLFHRYEYPLVFIITNLDQLDFMHALLQLQLRSKKGYVNRRQLIKADPTIAMDKTSNNASRR